MAFSVTSLVAKPMHDTLRQQGALNSFLISNKPSALVTAKAATALSGKERTTAYAPATGFRSSPHVTRPDRD